jgi:hypothetical protein
MELEPLFEMTIFIEYFEAKVLGGVRWMTDHDRSCAVPGEGVFHRLST